MAGRLAAWVWVDNEWYGPDSNVPADVAAKIDNPKAWAEKPEPAEPISSPEPEAPAPPAGNASLEDWQEYARSQGATEADLEDKKRDDLRDQYGK